MRQLFCIVYTTLIGAACTFGAMLGLNTEANVVFCVGASICFLTAIGCAAQYGGFSVGTNDDPDDMEE